MERCYFAFMGFVCDWLPRLFVILVLIGFIFFIVPCVDCLTREEISTKKFECVITHTEVAEHTHYVYVANDSFSTRVIVSQKVYASLKDGDKCTVYRTHYHTLILHRHSYSYKII